MIASRGDELPVSLLPADGTYPIGTAKWEKRNISIFVPVWEQDICIQCGNCSFVCPHSVIRSKFYSEALLEGAPEGFKSAPIDARGFPDTHDHQGDDAGGDDEGSEDKLVHGQISLAW